MKILLNLLCQYNNIYIKEKKVQTKDKKKKKVTTVAIMPPGTAAIVPKKKKRSASPKFTVDEQ